MYKLNVKMVIAVVVIIAVVLLLIFTLHHKTISVAVVSKPSFTDLENSLHVFSSPTLSFNFTSSFSLKNTTGLLISNNSYNSVRLYYNANNSAFITAVQYSENSSSAINYSTIKKLLPAGYHLNNLTILGYNAVDIMENETDLVPALYIIGPKGYYTVVSLTNPYNLSPLSMNQSISYILETMTFNKSKYIS